MKKLLFKSFSLIGMLCLSTQSNAMDISPIICQNRQCLPAHQAVTKDHLFEHINYLLEKNINAPISMCEADPASKTCFKKGISLPVFTNNAQVNMDVLSARLIDVKKVPDSAGLDLIVDYKTKAGNIFPSCQTAYSRLGILDHNTIQVIAPSFSCNLTQTTPSPLSLAQYVDYINFDTGTIGVHYTSANAIGQNKTGYLILQFSQQAPFSSHPAFPMPEVAQLVQTKIETPAHTKVDPVWMKPTPVLSLEKPTFVDQDCMNTPGGCQNLMLGAKNTQPQIQQPATQQGVASTTGLIEQDKVILPPTQGIRKTITTRKQIIEEGKPISVEEAVVHYIQETPSSPLKIVDPNKQKESMQPKELANPEMPQMIYPVALTGQETLPEYIAPQEVILSLEEVEAINQAAPTTIEKQEVAPQPVVLSKPQTEIPVVIQDNSVTKEEQSSLLDKFEKYFYF